MEDFERLLVPEAIRRIADDSDRQLAWQFFLVFSRFEYALKREKYIQAKSKDAKPAWKTFAKDHAEMFSADEDIRLKKAIEYFQRAPPKKQIHVDLVLDWDDPTYYSGGLLLPWLVEQIQIVRNNLFHGGKFPQFIVSDPSRDRALIESALVILSHALKLNSNIEYRFNEGIDL